MAQVAGSGMVEERVPLFYRLYPQHEKGLDPTKDSLPRWRQREESSDDDEPELPSDQVMSGAFAGLKALQSQQSEGSQPAPAMSSAASEVPNVRGQGADILKQQLLDALQASEAVPSVEGVAETTAAAHAGAAVAAATAVPPPAATAAAASATTASSVAATEQSASQLQAEIGRASCRERV